ncbi:hypothetical protein ACS0TY_008194 [Phlomoides rotata]
MGSLSSCFRVPDVQDHPASNNSVRSQSCFGHKCLFQWFRNKHGRIFRLGQMRGVSSPNDQQLSCSNSGLVSNNSSDAASDGAQGNAMARERRENSESAAKDLPSHTFPDEDLCPTCLEEYTEENPKIIAECSHHYHLSCIYEWMERSSKCPMCGKLMLFDE